MIFFVGSGATHGLSVKMKSPEIRVPPPVDSKFWEDLGPFFLKDDWLQNQYPAIHYFLETIGLLKNGKILANSLEQVWNLVNVLHKHLQHSRDQDAYPIFEISKNKEKDFFEKIEKRFAQEHAESKPENHCS